MKFKHEGVFVDAKLIPFDMWADGYIGFSMLQVNGDNVVRSLTGFDMTYPEAEELYFRIGAQLSHFRDMEEMTKRADEYAELEELLENWRAL